MKLIMRGVADIEIDVKGLRFGPDEALLARVNLEGIPNQQRREYMRRVKEELSKNFPIVTIVVVEDRIDVTKLDLSEHK